MKLSLKQRVVLRVLGVKISGDGTRWTAPRKHAVIVERAFRRAVQDCWVEGVDARLVVVPGDGLTIRGPEKAVTLRWLP